MFSIHTRFQAWKNAPERRRSGEVDFGVRWTRRDGLEEPTWRISWLEQTGELYAVRNNARPDAYIMIEVFRERIDADDAMQGWEHRADGRLHLEDIIDQAQAFAAGL